MSDGTLAECYGIAGPCGYDPLNGSLLTWSTVVDAAAKTVSVGASHYERAVGRTHLGQGPCR